MKKQVALMFSGGIDSTAAVIELAKNFDKIHLLNYENGYWHYNFRRSFERYNELLKKMGRKRLVYYHTSVKTIFDKMLVKDVIEEYQRYKSGFIWCLGCKLSMHLKTILYCLEKRIKYAADGSSKDTSEFVEQMPISLSSIKMIYKKYGINYLTPVYNKKRIEKIELLKKNNLRLGIPIGIGNRFLGIQPRCIPGELYYLPGVLLNRFPVHCEKDVYRFINSKLDLIDKIINDIFR